MATRIDRLFCLLQDGQNALVRQTAAQQIGEISQTDPDKLDLLLDKVSFFNKCIHFIYHSFTFITQYAVIQAAVQ